MIFNRFTKEARRCVEAAMVEARMLGHDSVGDEDLLFGILASYKGAATEALSSLGVTLQVARQESERMLAEVPLDIGVSLEEISREAGDAFDMSIPVDRQILFSPRAKKALQRALEQAVRLRDNYIGMEHVLLGILENEEGTAVRMLARRGVSPEMVRSRLSELHG